VAVLVIRDRTVFARAGAKLKTHSVSSQGTTFSPNTAH